MKSSSQELYEAVMALTNYDAGPNGTTSYGNIANFAKGAYEISESFNDVNYRLCEGWATTAEFAGKMQSRILGVLEGLSTELKRFTVSTIEDEAVASAAAEEANNTANSILDELGIE